MNPHRPFGPADFKSAASASFAIPAIGNKLVNDTFFGVFFRLCSNCKVRVLCASSLDLLRSIAKVSVRNDVVSSENRSAASSIFALATMNLRRTTEPTVH